MYIYLSTELAESTVTKAQIFEDDGQYAKANSLSATLPKNNDEVVIISGDDFLRLFTVLAAIKSILLNFLPDSVVEIIEG